MKNIKPIVQVMNLFSLVRINAAKSKVDEFGMTSSVLTKIISSIMYNDNIVLDKNSIVPDPTKPILNIYIASDYGFCSTYNQVVSSKIKETKDDYKIIIGKKITYIDDKVIMKLSKENFYNDLPKIKDYLVNAVNNREFREINIYYNHYYNFSRSDFTCLQVFPVEYNEEYKENVDFLVETDIKSFINNLIAYYVCYQLEICEIFSWAAENVIRNTMTASSLKKIEELEEIDRIKTIKELRAKSLKKNIENSKKVIFTNIVEED
ncbi:MAG: F0F1 ATP synthase subunit gamma [Bacilli bacterium]|nr:F0F1 ATP synthase subunit gamma [Bacilli bacterium]